MSISSTASRSRLPPNFAPSSAASSQQQQHPFDRVPSSSASSSSSYGHQQQPYQQQGSYTASPAPSSSAHFSSYTPSSGGRDRMPSASSFASGAPPPPSGGPGASGIKPSAAAMGDDERRAIAHVYWEELGDFLVDFLKREPPNARINAREKLTRLSKQQFHELSTDVYDELVRRRTDEQESVPYLPVKQEFHPKRNAARQKLASLTKNRFKDLASDVYYELLRRNPAFQAQQPGSAEQEEELTESDLQYPRSAPANDSAPNGSSAAADMARSRSASVSSDQQQYRPQQPQTNPYFPSTFQTEQQQQRERSASSASSRSQGRHVVNGSVSSVASMRGPPLQVVNDQPSSYPSTAASHARQGSHSSRSTVAPLRPPSPTSSSSHDHSRAQQQQLPKQSVTTSNVVPTKSTMALESIQVPFSRDSEYVTSEGGDAPPSPGFTDGGADASYDRTSFSSAASRARGLGMAAALGISNGPAEGAAGDRSQGDRVGEDLRKDYEFKIASLSGRVGTLEAELERRGREVQDERGARERAESDVEVVKKQLETFNSTLTQIRQELENTRSAYAREKARSTSLEASLAAAPKQQPGSGSGAVDDDLRLQVKDLVTELNSLSLQNDQLQSEADREREAVMAAEGRARELEKKWKATKTELRNLKATSQMFVTAPRSEDHLPASKDGALADTHVTAFQTAIDGLITAARSTSPTSTLGAMKAVILAVADISRDVQEFEARSPDQRSHVDSAELADLKNRSTVSLNMLTASSKEFAMSYGLSPISLLDAAASEAASPVVGLIKLLGIRREKKDVDYRSELAAMQEAVAEEDDEDEQTLNGSRTDRSLGAFEFPPSAARPAHSRQSSEGSNYDVRDSTITAKPSPPSSPTVADDDRVGSQNYRLTSTSSIVSSGSAFDLERKASLAETESSSKGSQHGWSGAGGKPSWDSRPANGFRSPFDQNDDDDGEPDGEQAWAQLRPYLETQSESLISAIQTLLASVRSGSPATELRENLSSVIVIGSSIVGVSKDSLPLRAVGEGRRLLRALAGNCELLSELSEGEEMGKDVRNQIATTTFELAKNLKSLLSL